MHNTIKSIENNKKTILGILISPFILIILNILATCIFNIGTYCGTFLRCLYTIVVYL